MNVLVLAPHPFYQERGTPIDVSLVLRVLSERSHCRVDLLVYNEGTDIELPRLTIHRTPDLRITRNMRPGFSLRKLFCDLLFWRKAWSLVRTGDYALIHAGEEAVFFAMFFKLLYGIPYVYDLDSSIAQQLVEKKPFLRIFAPFFNWLEALAIRGSVANLPVCNALAELCRKRGSRKTVTIHDISQLKDPYAKPTGMLRQEAGIAADKVILLYIGNLEVYQGIDLLLESYHVASKRIDTMELVILGGVDAHRTHYEEKARSLGIDATTHFLGPKPFEQLDRYLAEADILVCPRIRGVNTPMKVFPYLHSGKPVLATDLYTHNQLLTTNEAYLAPAAPEAFAEGIVALVQSPSLREQLGARGRAFVERDHTYRAHQERLHGVYDWIEDHIVKKRA